MFIMRFISKPRSYKRILQKVEGFIYVFKSSIRKEHLIIKSRLKDVKESTVYAH